MFRSAKGASGHPVQRATSALHVLRRVVRYAGSSFRRPGGGCQDELLNSERRADNSVLFGALVVTHD